SPRSAGTPTGGKAWLRPLEWSRAPWPRLNCRTKSSPSPSSRSRLMTNRIEHPSPAALPNEADVASYRHWIARAADVCERAARGDLEARLLRVPLGGDLGRMLLGINHLLDMTDAFVRESQAALQHAAEGKFFRLVVLRGMLGSFRQASRAGNSATEAMA